MVACRSADANTRPASRNAVYGTGLHFMRTLLATKAAMNMNKDKRNDPRMSLRRRRIASMLMCAAPQVNKPNKL